MKPSNNELYAREGALTAHGYPLDDADPRHDPHCGWHWNNRCNCSQALKAEIIIRHVVGGLNV